MTMLTDLLFLVRVLFNMISVLTSHLVILNFKCNSLEKIAVTHSFYEM
jgi:hypothetical protein